jgi:hypothetical protein
MKRKLSAIEHMIDGNIVYFVRLEGHFQAEKLRSAIARLQYKHPALRMLIRKERDGLYYEFDCAPEVPLRIVSRVRESDYRRESAVELRAHFAHDRPQLRVVWLRSDQEQDLLFVASHRICDGMSMLTIVREVLRFLHKDEIPTPYEPISPDDIIGDYQPPNPGKRRIQAHLVNAILGLIPKSRKDPGNNEYALEWCADQEMTDALRQRCRSEGVSVHAALTVGLDRALYAVLGERKMPAWIESPMDARRGRLAVLRSDMLFFGGGSLKVHTGGNPGGAFWERARVVHGELRGMIDQELLNIPGRFQFFGMLRPLPDARIHTMVRMADALKINGSWNRIALSNLGDVIVVEPDAPFRLKDLRIYVHSFNIRLLGLVSYLLNGEMRFCYVGDEKCMSRNQAEALRNQMMAILRDRISESNRCHEEVSLNVHSLAG